MLGHNKQINDKKNFEEKVDSIEIILKKWEKRELTLFGRGPSVENFCLVQTDITCNNNVHTTQDN